MDTDWLARAPLALSLLLWLPLACGEDEKDDDGDDEPPSAWLVGDEGSMLRVGLDGDVGGYDLDRTGDLTAIACTGTASAWVVGDAGLVLRSRDAGATWDAIDVGASARLSGVAVAEATLEGSETVWIVGEDGTVATTRDGGGHWQAVLAPGVDFTGVASDHHGLAALAVADDGSIWRLHEGGAIPLAQAEPALRAIGMAGRGERAVAVGDAGTMLASPDGGTTWSAVPAGTARDLHAVVVSEDGALAVAVGDAGTVVRAPTGGSPTTEQIGDVALHGLHLRGDGLGQIVGEAGTLLVTHDAGVTWSELATDTATTLRGVDDFHGGGHL